MCDQQTDRQIMQEPTWPRFDEEIMHELKLDFLNLLIPKFIPQKQKFSQEPKFKKVDIDLVLRMRKDKHFQQRLFQLLDNKNEQSVSSSVSDTD